MVASLADIRFLWIILFVCGFGFGARSQQAPPHVFGLRLEESNNHVYMRERVIIASYGSRFKLRLFGYYPLNGTWPWVAFAGETKDVQAGAVWTPEDPCKQDKLRNSSAFQVHGEFEADDEISGLIEVHTVERNISAATKLEDDERPVFYHLCIFKEPDWQSVGSDRLRVKYPDLPPDSVPTWGLAIITIVLLFICGVIRNLNLSLLWLDPLELYVLHSCGSEDERLFAKRLEPIRRRGNFLVCSLLVICALCHSALGVLLYRAFGSVLPAVFTCGALIFLLAELLPHIISSGYGFHIAPGMIWLAQTCLIVTCPLSCPLGLLLDVAFRRDVSTCSVREKIMEMIRSNVNDPYNEFVKEEFRRGTLRTKTVEDILTPLKDCFMLPSTAVLDFSTMSEIMQSGYTRVPVYEEEKSNIIEILYVKDLALVDPADCTPMTTITKFYNHPLHYVFNDTKLDAMLEEFKKGNSHLAIVQRVNNEGEGDPFYEVLGLVTLEDVIEEIIKSEILDESDGYMNMKVKRPPAQLEIPLEPHSAQEEFSLFKEPDGEQKIRTSPQLLLATHRFLSREVEHFSPQRVSEKVLFHLLRHPNVNQEVKFDLSNRLSADHYLYTRNHPVDYFILLLQGRVEVEIGKEGLKFENGAFTYYGVSALTAPSSVHQSPVSTQHHSPRDPFELGDATSPSSYCPDYTVRALTDLQIIKVTRLQYLNALMASRVAHSPGLPEIKILPNSQTKLLNEKNTTQGASRIQEGGTDETLALKEAIRLSNFQAYGYKSCYTTVERHWLCITRVNLQTCSSFKIPLEMEQTDLFKLESCIEVDSAFESVNMDFDEPDCPGMAGRCALHEGIQIEIQEQPCSMRQLVTIVIAMQKFKSHQRVQSTMFTDHELLNIIIENVAEESMAKVMHSHVSNTYNKQKTGVMCTVCDKLQKSLVKSSFAPVLQAVTLQAGNLDRRVWLNLSNYTSPSHTDSRGQPVCLGIAKTNLYLSCTNLSGTPTLSIEEIQDKETLKIINTNNEMERFLFYRKGTGASINTFESVKYPHWFISTTQTDYDPVDMCEETNATRLRAFTLPDQKPFDDN
ncbi:metal transporter CNNM3 [Brachyhypopomus gauderio]|uniref:metal transporter CNNM3 n=1 Tax=Brachyhypopomus gauderio TaxID=698409 RepID=UPI0040436885